MKTLRVWAPNAQRMTVQIGQRRLEMEKEGEETRGWWRVSAPEIIAGADCAFFVDQDKRPLPDPRSRFQPHGVHRASRIVDDRAFAWSDQLFSPTPLSQAIVYEIHIGTFTPDGTFDSAIERLDHLAELGVTHVELMPVVEFS